MLRENGWRGETNKERVEKVDGGMEEWWLLIWCLDMIEKYKREMRKDLARGFVLEWKQWGVKRLIEITRTEKGYIVQYGRWLTVVELGRPERKREKGDMRWDQTKNEIFPLGFDNAALWSRSNKNTNWNTGPLAHPFACIAYSFACSALLASLTRSLCSLPRSWDSK